MPPETKALISNILGCLGLILLNVAFLYNVNQQGNLNRELIQANSSLFDRCNKLDERSQILEGRVRLLEREKP